MDKVKVSDKQCEQAVLGVLIGYENAFIESADILRTELFYFPKHQALYDAIKGVYEAGEAITILTVFEYTQKHPDKEHPIEAVYITECTGAVVSTLGFREHCARLRDLWQRRQMWTVGVMLENAGTSEVGETAEIKQKAVEAIQALDDSPQANIMSVGDAIRQLDVIVNANLTGERKNGIPTGFRYLDDRGGLQRTDLVVIGAEFSQGKTSLALDMAVSAARSGYPVAFYSAEMMSTQLAARMLASDSGVSSRTIMQQPMNEEQLSIYDKAIGRMEQLPIYFDDTSTMSVERIISSIRMMARKKQIAVAFIDYLQILQCNEKYMRQTEEQFFGVACRRLKNLAKELNICIVLISQIARSKDTTEPTLSRIRGSGQITEAADVVLLIYRPEFYVKRYSGEYSDIDPKGTALIKLAKGRNIGTGAFICGYDAPTTHFYELATIPKQAGGTGATGIADENRPF